MITSTSNQKIKDVIALCKKPSLRREKNLFVVEGIRMFSEIPDKNIREVYVSENFYYSADEKLQKRLQNLHAETVSNTVCEYMSDTKTPQGILAVVDMQRYELSDVTGGLVIVLERLQDPGNLGTILRTAEAAGAGIIMDKDTVDIYNPKVVRSTMGAVFRVPFVVVDSLYDSAMLLKNKNYKIYAAHLKGAEDFDREKYPEKAAFMIGNEAAGLSDEIAALADKYIRIPMQGKVESLNASVAASLIMYEYYKQMRNK